MSKQKSKKCNRILAFLLTALLIFSDQSLLTVLATEGAAYEEELVIEEPTNEGEINGENPSEEGTEEDGSEENPSDVGEDSEDAEKEEFLPSN